MKIYEDYETLLLKWMSSVWWLMKMYYCDESVQDEICHLIDLWICSDALMKIPDYDENLSLQLEFIYQFDDIFINIMKVDQSDKNSLM